MGPPKNPVLRWLFRVPIGFFRVRLGWVFAGRLVLIEHYGRKSGRLRRTVVEVVRADRGARTYEVVSGWGRGADWYRNALAHPPRLIDTGRDRYAPRVHELDEAERLELLTAYQRSRPRLAAALGRQLMGEEFTSAPSDLARLAAHVGALRFEPATGARAD